MTRPTGFRHTPRQRFQLARSACQARIGLEETGRRPESDPFGRASLRKELPRAHSCRYIAPRAFRSDDTKPHPRHRGRSLLLVSNGAVQEETKEKQMNTKSLILAA